MSMNQQIISSQVELDGFVEPYKIIREHFHEMKSGQVCLIKAKHRDMHVFGYVNGDYFLLPDRNEVPNTFSLRGIIQDALISVCPEADKNYEEIDFSKAGDIDVAQGFWKFLDLKIEDGYIYATIKKI